MKNSEMKSKVMSMGNRLAPRMDGDRRAAFMRAWAIVKAGGLELVVKGTSFGTRQEALKRLTAYAPDQVRAVLVPEPTNPVDHAAVVTAMGVKLPALRVVSGTRGWNGKTAFGARVALAV